MKILGYILIVVGVVDFGGSFVGFDLWLEVFWYQFNRNFIPVFQH